MHPPSALLLAAFLASQDARDDGARERALALGRQYVQEARQASRRDSVECEREEPALAARRRALEAELATLGAHPWAGWYSEGDGLGHNVRLGIAPRAGAVYTLSGCLGLYDLNHGEIERVDARGIELHLALDPALNGQVWRAALPRPVMSSRWVPVPWGDERYLIPECQLIAFCNEVNAGGDGHSFPRREADVRARARQPRPDGLPELPPDYAPFLLRQELEAVLEDASEPRAVGTFEGGSPEKFLVSAEIALGLEHGLLPGMILHAPADKRGECEIVVLERTRARLEFHFANYDPERDVPRDGWRVTTRKPARRWR